MQSLPALVLAIASSTSNDLIAQTQEASAPTGLVARQWDVANIPLHAARLPNQPADVELSASFSHESGSQIKVPGFWNGDHDYLVRFTPPIPGLWRYVTQSTLNSLDGNNGEISVLPAAEGRTGGVTVAQARPRTFAYESGRPCFPIAFECDWLFALDAENPDDIPVTRKFVDTLADAGFNQVVMNVFAYDVNWEKDQRILAKHDYGSPRVFPFGGSNDQPDHSRLNIEYFQRLDRVISYLNQKGIAAHLMIYVWNKRVNWPPANSAADNRYFDYVVKRYQAYPNLIWDISKEALGYGHTDVNYISERIERLRGLDAHSRLVTVHDYGYCKRFPERLDFISVQLWGSELYGIMRDTCEQFPGKPILNIEHGGYEACPYEVFNGNYTSAEVCLERAYQCVFAGTYPTHYWQGAAWNIIFADIEAMAPADRPKLDYYRHLRHLNDRYELSRLTAGGKHSNSGFCLHDGKDLYIYYVPKENISMNLRFPQEKRGRSMTSIWFDPFLGSSSDPVISQIEQWPVVKKPKSDRFAILIVETGPEPKQTASTP